MMTTKDKIIAIDLGGTSAKLAIVSTEGEILYKGEQIKYDKKSLYNLRKEVGIVFQDPEKQIFY